MKDIVIVVVFAAVVVVAFVPGLASAQPGNVTNNTTNNTTPECGSLCQTLKKTMPVFEARAWHYPDINSQK
ncbi:MAG: hypothetical protein GEU26_15790 [Nitrososphaeraceae archaeon]|nr:hypothetical protein [Nitrososphaeraceae archaeon]